MTETAISPLRRRMIEDMTVRNFAADTQRNYIRAVKNLAIFLGRSPDTATRDDLRLFQLHLTENHVRPPTINGTVTALRFFFTVTVDRPDVTKPLTWNPNDPSYAGKHWTVKNLLELKNAQRVTISGNQFENNWLDAQVGFAVLILWYCGPL